MKRGTHAPDRTAARLISGGAAVVSLSVLADSGLEHYRGSFRNPAMVLPLVTSVLTLGFAGQRAARAGSTALPALPALRGASHVGSIATGLLGLGFHAFNICKRPGGVSFTNLFYAAPLGAPAALTLAGTLAVAGDRLAQHPGGVLATGRILGGLAALGIAGTVAETALLHFRGAFHNPAMWLPLAVPPAAAISLARDAITGLPRQDTATLLAATAALGVIGVGFHAYGVHRNMGGWRNWRQNILVGPPLPAPPAFAGLALAALGAWLLMRRNARD